MSGVFVIFCSSKQVGRHATFISFHEEVSEAIMSMLNDWPGTHVKERMYDNEEYKLLLEDKEKHEWVAEAMYLDEHNWATLPPDHYRRLRDNMNIQSTTTGRVKS